MRAQFYWGAAVLVVALGVAGLARGATPPPGSKDSVTSDSQPIVVTGAYVRQPASDSVAAAYFTVYNTTGVADTLVSVASGAGGESSLHTDTGGAMTDNPNGIPIPAHGTVVFKPGTAHVMIQKLYGTLAAGQTVDIQLTFATAGQVVVVAPVIGIYAPAPTGAAVTTAPASSSGALTPSSSGAIPSASPSVSATPSGAAS